MYSCIVAMLYKNTLSTATVLGIAVKQAQLNVSQHYYAQ
jgi:hypothetical protein